MVDDVIYVFGGRGVDGKDLGDLGAFKLSSEIILLAVVPASLTNWISHRSTMVYVPEDGSCSFGEVRTRYGFDGKQSLCPGRSWRRIFEPR